MASPQLWRRPTAAAQIQSLARELPYALSAAKKKKKFFIMGDGIIHNFYYFPCTYPIFTFLPKITSLFYKGMSVLF